MPNWRNDLRSVCSAHSCHNQFDQAPPRYPKQQWLLSLKKATVTSSSLPPHYLPLTHLTATYDPCPPLNLTLSSLTHPSISPPFHGMPSQYYQFLSWLETWASFSCGWAAAWEMDWNVDGRSLHGMIHSHLMWLHKFGVDSIHQPQTWWNTAARVKSHVKSTLRLDWTGLRHLLDSISESAWSLSWGNTMPSPPCMQAMCPPKPGTHPRPGGSPQSWQGTLDLLEGSSIYNDS